MRTETTVDQVRLDRETIQCPLCKAVINRFSTPDPPPTRAAERPVLERYAPRPWQLRKGTTVIEDAYGRDVVVIVARVSNGKVEGQRAQTIIDYLTQAERDTDHATLLRQKRELVEALGSCLQALESLDDRERH